MEFQGPFRYRISPTNLLQWRAEFREGWPLIDSRGTVIGFAFTEAIAKALTDTDSPSNAGLTEKLNRIEGMIEDAKDAASSAETQLIFLRGDIAKGKI